MSPRALTPLAASWAGVGQGTVLPVLLGDYGQHRGAAVHPEHPAKVSLVKAGDKILNPHSKDSIRESHFPSSRDIYLPYASRNERRAVA